jgi:hypothetical protein
MSLTNIICQILWRDILKVWIDTETGRWGGMEGLVIVDLDVVAAGEKSGHGIHSLLDFLECADDSDPKINDFGIKYGVPVQIDDTRKSLRSES